MPVEPVFIELDDCLWDLDVGFFGGHQVGFLGSLPLDQEEELPGLIGGSDDLLWLETPSEPSQLLLSFTFRVHLGGLAFTLLHVGGSTLVRAGVGFHRNASLGCQILQ